MALDAVVGEIKAKGEKEAGDIIAAGNVEKLRLLAKAKSEADAIKIAAKADADTQTEFILRQEVAAAHLAAKRAQLNAEKDVLDKAYAEVLAAIDGLPEEVHQKTVRELCKKSAKELGEGVFYCCERDQAAVEDALSSLKTLSKFSLAGTIDISGGIIAESADGAFQLDYSYLTYVNEVWKIGLKDASEILFR